MNAGFHYSMRGHIPTVVFRIYIVLLEGIMGASM